MLCYVWRERAPQAKFFKKVNYFLKIYALKSGFNIGTKMGKIMQNKTFMENKAAIGYGMQK